jgi:hypothetical protein
MRYYVYRWQECSVHFDGGAELSIYDASVLSGCGVAGLLLCAQVGGGREEWQLALRTCCCAGGGREGWQLALLGSECTLSLCTSAWV